MAAGSRKQTNASLEFTVLAVGLGIILAIIMCAANIYMGLYAGMTVSASIPAAVVSMAILRGIFRRGSLLENNIVQTMASAGESLAAGVVFTVPAIVLVKIWGDFEFWPTVLIAVCGGLLGVLFMIPLRRSLIVEDKTLTYPEGVACAAVLRTGEHGMEGIKYIAGGLFLGALIKLLNAGMSLLKATVETALLWNNRIFYTGCDVSPALLAVGYIVNIRIAFLIFAGGCFAWNIVMPFLPVPSGMEGASAVKIAGELWNTQIRYLGVGAMIVGGLWSIINVRSGIALSIKQLFRISAKDTGQMIPRHERDLDPRIIGSVAVVTIAAVFVLYWTLTRQFGISLITTIIMGFASFFFVAVSSYVVGLVGSSNNPVSGMTICALLGTAVLLMGMGMKGTTAIYATLGVAGVVCCAACSAGDISQDLKTGSLVKATPKWQQTAQIIAVIVPAFIIPPIMSLLNQAYGIGTGLKAPQATLFASITEGLFGSGDLPRQMIGAGILLGIFIIFADRILEYKGKQLRLHVMPIAVGIYLPLSLSVPIFLGGLIRFLSDLRRHRKSPGDSPDKQSQSGILLASGIIAGEAVIGIVLAALMYLGINLDMSMDVAGFHAFSTFFSIVALAGVAIYLYRE
ncbi:oligopeptide transporter, OPT family [bacterium]|nr:oligopeptide transporter, OPT family [candidate division CSSED10-310 bacterium]